LLCDKEGRVSLMTLEEVEAHGGKPSIFSQVAERAAGEDGPNFG
jgi:hypothetical protein